MRLLRASLLLVAHSAAALRVCGVELTNARPSATSRALDGREWPAAFPFTESDLTPEWAGSDGLFYLLPKFVQHAGEECRSSLTEFYRQVLPPAGSGDVLDLCSSFTSHYPKGWRGRRMVAVGLNPLELALNPSKTEWRVQDLNKRPELPFDDNSFDLITNSLSVDYMTRPLELFSEMARVLKPDGLACMAFTNCCFPTKIVPAWSRPFTDAHHAYVVGSYFRYSSDAWAEVAVADVSPEGWVGQRDPAIVVIGRKKSS